MDLYYLILVLPAVLFAMWASLRVNTTFDRYRKQASACRMTGADAARAVLDAHGLQYIRIEHVSGKLTDHYDPGNQVIRLSDSTYSDTSVAAIGVAAHEAGHAIQYAENYAPIRLRSTIIPVTNIGSQLAMPLILIGILFAGVSSFFSTLAYIGVACYALITVFQLVTLPVEFNASGRAVRVLENMRILSADELKGTKKVLRAAAMTYVAALAVSLMQLLRLILIVGGNNDRRRR